MVSKPATPRGRVGRRGLQCGADSCLDISCILVAVTVYHRNSLRAAIVHQLPPGLLSLSSSFPDSGILRVAPGILSGPRQSPAGIITRIAIHSWEPRARPLGRSCQNINWPVLAAFVSGPHHLGGFFAQRHRSARAGLHCVCPFWRYSATVRVGG